MDVALLVSSEVTGVTPEYGTHNEDHDYIGKELLDESSSLMIKASLLLFISAS